MVFYPRTQANRREQGLHRSSVTERTILFTPKIKTKPPSQAPTLKDPWIVKSLPGSTWPQGSCLQLLLLSRLFNIYSTEDPAKQQCAFLSWITIPKNQTDRRLKQDSFSGLQELAQNFFCDRVLSSNFMILPPQPLQKHSTRLALMLNPLSHPDKTVLNHGSSVLQELLPSSPVMEDPSPRHPGHTAKKSGFKWEMLWKLSPSNSPPSECWWYQGRPRRQAGLAKAPRHNYPCSKIFQRGQNQLPVFFLAEKQM